MTSRSSRIALLGVVVVVVVAALAVRRTERPAATDVTPVESMDRLDDVASEADLVTPTNRVRRTPEVDRTTEVPAASEAGSATSVSALDPPAHDDRNDHFTVVLVDVDEQPVFGISASIRFARPSKVAPSIEGLPDGFPSFPSKEWIDGPSVMSGRDGEMSVACYPRLGDEVTASFRFDLAPGSPYAVLDKVTLRPGERRRIVVQRGGSIAVQVVPAIPGSALRARASSSRDLVNGFDVILSLKKDRQPSMRFGTSPVDGAVVWEGLEPGVYEITASALGGPASWLELASLAELVVEPGRACRDPRLLSWDPFDGHEVMALRVEGPGGGHPPALDISFAAPGGTNAWYSNPTRVRYDGRALPIVAPPGLASEFVLGAPGLKQVRFSVEPGPRVVRLERE
ncbi:MAG: hypothetical protein AAF726_02465 [Planctomycetota bacterium]